MFSPRRPAAVLLILGIGAVLLIHYIHYAKVEMTAKQLVGLDFEVFGRVQGVFFRKTFVPTDQQKRRRQRLRGWISTLSYISPNIEYTQEKGRQLGLKGWCRNTDRGTVVGYVEGDKGKVEDMKRWLQYTGSPQSQIEKAEFRSEKEITETQFSDFKIKK